MAFALGVLASLWPVRALAANRPCAIAWALGELTTGERTALLRTCEGKEDADPVALQSAVFRMVSLAGWRGAALARLLAPLRGHEARMLQDSDAHGVPDLVRAQARLAARPETLAGPACANLRRLVEQFVVDAQAGQAAASPFLHDDSPLLACLGLTSAALHDVRLVAFRADNVEGLFVAAAAPSFAYMTWLQPRDALVFDRHRFFVVAVPPGAPVTAVARLTNAEVPATWTEIVAYDTVAWAEPPAMTCISLDVRLGPNTAIHVDGVPVPRDESGVSRVLAVSRNAHTVVAIECPTPGRPCYVRYREEIDAATLQRREHQCTGVRLDLVTRERATVAVLDATQGSACRDAPLRADGLRQGAMEYTAVGPGRRAYEIRDLAAFAAASDALSALRTRLTAGSGTAVGASAGADGADLIGTSAKEAWRQGIDLLLSFDLQCTQRSEGWTYRLAATRIALSSVFGRGRYSGDSLDLRSFVEVESEEFRAVELLPIALANVIDRSLDVPYLRLYGETIAVPYRKRAELTIDRFTSSACETGCPGRPDDACRRACAERPVVVTARRLTLGQGRPDLCRHLAQSPIHGPDLLARAAARFAAGSGAPIAMSVWGNPAAGGDPLTGSSTTTLRGPLPGWYLVVARWADEQAPADATCIELTSANHELWADVTLSTGGMFVLPRKTSERLYLRARLGYVYYPRPIVGLGVVAGYALSQHAWHAGRPSWTDLAVADTGSLVWARHALLIGGAVELRSRHARVPVDLRLRATPTISVGLLRVGKIPRELAQFLGADGDQAADLDVDFNMHFDGVIGYNVGPVAIQHILTMGILAVSQPLTRTPVSVRDNGGLFLGLGLGIGGAR